MHGHPCLPWGAGGVIGQRALHLAFLVDRHHGHTHCADHPACSVEPHRAPVANAQRRQQGSNAMQKGAEDDEHDRAAPNAEAQVIDMEHYREHQHEGADAGHGCTCLGETHQTTDTVDGKSDRRDKQHRRRGVNSLGLETSSLRAQFCCGHGHDRSPSTHAQGPDDLVLEDNDIHMFTSHVDVNECADHDPPALDEPDASQCLVQDWS